MAHMTLYDSYDSYDSYDIQTEQRNNNTLKIRFHQQQNDHLPSGHPTWLAGKSPSYFDEFSQLLDASLIGYVFPI